jgi:hypothetical protein
MVDIAQVPKLLDNIGGCIHIEDRLLNPYFKLLQQNLGNTK